MPLPQPWTRSAFVGHMRSVGIGVVASDAFTVEGQPPEAVRVCLGGPTRQPELRNALDYMAHALLEKAKMKLILPHDCLVAPSISARASARAAAPPRWPASRPRNRARERASA